jgi:hypothetical protein
VEPAGVESSVIITVEPKGHSVRQILEQVYASQGEIEIDVSVVTVAELVHGAYRARHLSCTKGGWRSSSGCPGTCPCIR